MTTIEEPIQRRRKDDKLLETLAGGSLVKAIGGAAAIVLSILGLARVYPYISLSIATIAVGVALLFEGGAIAAKYQRLLPATRPDQPGEGPGLQARTIELGGGMTSEFVGGAAHPVARRLAGTRRIAHDDRDQRARHTGARGHVFERRASLHTGILEPSRRLLTKHARAAYRP